MKLSELLRKTCKDMKISLSEVARRTNQTPQNLTMKLRRDSISFRDFLKYMDILGIRVDFKLIYPDGTSPDTPVPDLRSQEKIELLEANLAVEKRNVAYQQKLSADCRAVLSNIQEYVDAAMKNPKKSARVVDYLGKIKASGDALQRLLNSSICLCEKPATEEVAITAEEKQSVVGKRILLVEDNETSSAITKNILEENGMVVEVAQNGLEAVNQIQDAEAGYYDCVLMDIQMSIMDGYEATYKIRKLPNRRRSSVPVIAISANAFENDLEKIEEAGMDALLTKPLSAASVIHTIAKLL